MDKLVRITCESGSARVSGRRRTYRSNAITVLPRWLAGGRWAGNMLAATRKEAEWVLVDVGGYDPTRKGRLLYTHNGAAVPVLAIPFLKLGLTAYYLHVQTDIASLKPWARRYLVNMQAPDVLARYGFCDQQCLLRAVFEAEEKMDLEPRVSRAVLEILAGRRQLKNYPISQLHLRHITPAMVNDVIKREPSKLPRLAALNNIVEWGDNLGEATFTTMAVYLMLMPDEHYHIMKSSALWTDHLSPSEWAKRAKAISVRLKSIQHTVTIDCTPWFELDVLLNRGIGTVDWERERENRTTQIKVTTHSYEEIYHTAYEMFIEGKAEGRLPTPMRWDAFWGRRWEWATPGAIHTQHAQDEKYIPARRDIRTKWHTVCAMPHTPISHWLSRSPQMVAWPSVKYEWGKQRAIYGVDLTNYILATYGFAGAEDILPEQCPLGTHINADTIKARVQATTANLAPYCLDFDDFNSQHSISSMNAMLQAYIDAYRDVLDEQQIAACMWVVSALHDMQVRVAPHDSRQYRAVGTLLSGWRLTTFVNTVLNYCYVTIAKQGQHIPTLHSGDDVLAGVKSFSQARALEQALVAKGCRLQAAKCFLGSLCEFLRIDHLSQGSGQYLARATSTAVHAPVETRRPYMLSAILEALHTRYQELGARMADKRVLDSLKLTHLEKISRLWNVPISTLNEHASTHRAFGGLSTSRDALIGHQYVNTPAAGHAEAATTTVVPGASAYAWDVCHTLLIGQFFNQVQAQAQRALDIVAGDTTYTIAKTSIPGWVPEPAVLREKYGCNRTRDGFSSIKLLAGLGLPVLALSDTSAPAIAHYRQYPAEHRLAWMAVTV